MQRIGSGIASSPPGFGGTLSQLQNGAPSGEGSIRHVQTRPGFIAKENVNGSAIFGVMVSVAPGVTLTRSDISFAPAAATIARSDISFAVADQSINTAAGSFVAAGFVAGQVIRVTGSVLNNIVGTVVSVAALKMVVVVNGPGIETEGAGAVITILGGIENSVNTVAGNFITSGFLPGMTLTITGSALNNFSGGKIVSVTATKMILAGINLVTEAAGAADTLAGLPDQDALYVGIPPGYTPIGVILNEESVRLFDAEKPNFILNEQPATVAVRGRLAYQTFDQTFLGALVVPVVGCRVVCSNTTGAIGLLAAGAAVPAGYTQVKAAVVTVTPFGPPLKSVDLDLFMPVAS